MYGDPLLAQVYKDASDQKRMRDALDAKKEQSPVADGAVGGIAPPTFTMGTSPLLDMLRNFSRNGNKAMEQIVATARVGGAGIGDFVLGTDMMEKYAGPAFDKAWGLGKYASPGTATANAKLHPARPAPAPAAAAPAPAANVQTPAAPSEEAVPGEKAQSGPSYPSTSLYDAVAKLPDDKFVKFIEAHRHIPGLGYTKDPETGEISRLIEDPDLKPVQPMTNRQLDTAAKLLTGAGHVAYGIGQQKAAESHREMVNQAKVDANEIKRQTAFDNLLTSYSPKIKTVDENGNSKEEHDKATGLMRMIAEGQEITDPRYAATVPRYQKALKQITDDFDARYLELLKKNPKLKPLSQWTLSDKFESYQKSKAAASAK